MLYVMMKLPSLTVAVAGPPLLESMAPEFVTLVIKEASRPAGPWFQLKSIPILMPLGPTPERGRSSLKFFCAGDAGKNKAAARRQRTLGDVNRSNLGKSEFMFMRFVFFLYSVERLGGGPKRSIVAERPLRTKIPAGIFEA